MTVNLTPYCHSCRKYVPEAIATREFVPMSEEMKRKTFKKADRDKWDGCALPGIWIDSPSFPCQCGNFSQWELVSKCDQCGDWVASMNYCDKCKEDKEVKTA